MLLFPSLKYFINLIYSWLFVMYTWYTFIISLYILNEILLNENRRILQMNFLFLQRLLTTHIYFSTLSTIFKIFSFINKNSHNVNINPSAIILILLLFLSSLIILAKKKQHTLSNSFKDSHLSLPIL